MKPDEHKRQPNRKRDPNLDHPAVRMHRQIVRVSANHIQRRDIIAHINAALQEMGIDADRALLMWRATLENYMLTGKNPKNVGYMLDLYDERLRGPKWDRHNRR